MTLDYYYSNQKVLLFKQLVDYLTIFLKNYLSFLELERFSVIL